MRNLLGIIDTSTNGGMIRAYNILKELGQLAEMNMKIFSPFGSRYKLKNIIKRILYLYYAFPSATLYFPYPTQSAANIVKKVSKFSNRDTRFLIDFHEDIVAQAESIGYSFSRAFIKRQRLLHEFFFENDKTILIFTTEDFHKAYGAPNNSVIIHDGADPDIFRYTLLPSKPIVSFIGTITNKRGLEVLIDAVRIARKVEKSIQLRVYGFGQDTEYVNKIAQLVSDMGGQFMGKITHDEVPKAIENSFVCVNPLIRSEYFDLGEPLKLFEYMACGRPVIGSDIKQQRRIIESEKCGLVYHDKSPTELSEAILTLVNDPQKAQFYGKNGRKAIEERWSWKENVKRALPMLKYLGAIN